MEGLGFAKIRGIFVGLPMVRNVVFRVYIGPPYSGKLPQQNPRNSEKVAFLLKPYKAAA